LSALLDALTIALVTAGAVFFFAGTVGLLRLPDVYARLHALAKADNLGLGFVVAGLLLQAEGAGEALKLLLIWLAALGSSATASHLVARFALRSGVAAWSRR
jgi:multicomponent Na+:H+ antiporter subunit G